MPLIEALRSVPNYQLRYIAKVPVEVHRAALRYGWRFLPVPFNKHAIDKQETLIHATDTLLQLRHCARQCSNWALVTGPESGVFVIEVNGSEGLASFLDLCGDDWSWLDTLRSIANEQRHIFFSWPKGRRMIKRSRQIGANLLVLGEGDWLLVPLSRESQGTQQFYLNPQAAVDTAPSWLLDRIFERADAVNLSLPLLPRSAGCEVCSNVVAVNASNPPTTA